MVGAVIDPGFCLDLISSNGIAAIEEAYKDFSDFMLAFRIQMPQNRGGSDLLLRDLDCAVINFLHGSREETGQPAFDSVRGVFTEGDHIYENSGFRRKTYIQLCVRNPASIKGVFRVPAHHFSLPPSFLKPSSKP